MKTVTRILYANALALMTASICPAAVTEYQDADRDQWFADSGGTTNITTVDFTGFPSGTQITDQYDHFGVTFEGINSISQGQISFPDGWGLSVRFGNTLFFDNPIHSFGADYVGRYQLELFLGDQHLYTSDHFFEPGTGADFGGIIADEPFDRVIVYDPFDDLSVFDNFFFGPPIAVPAPSAFAAMALLPLTGRRRRRSMRSLESFQSRNSSRMTSKEKVRPGSIATSHSRSMVGV